MAFQPISSSGESDEIVAEINVTPLTDIFLVLLIIFMVTSSALTEQGQDVNLPRAEGQSSGQQGIVLTLFADEIVKLNGDAVNDADLREKLTPLLATTAEKSITLQGDRGVVLERAVQVMAIAKRAGALHINIATAAPE